MVATGGTLGNALFMFVSGYTLLLGRFDRFDNWYKRRINRIYPSLIAWMIILAVASSNLLNIRLLATGGGKWFITCIMIYYAVLYIVRYFLPKYKWTIFTLSSIISVLWYVLMEDTSVFFMYRNTLFKYFYWFPFMLIGAYIGAGYIQFNLNPVKDSIIAFICLVCHYAISTVCVFIPQYCYLQIFSLIPLFGFTIYIYKVAQTKLIKESLKNSKAGVWITAIASLCLEAYIVQETLFTTAFNSIFPLNIIINILYVLLVAYIVRCLGRFFKQTWESEPYRWNEIVKLV